MTAGSVPRFRPRFDPPLRTPSLADPRAEHDGAVGRPARRRPRLGDLAELVRAPAALSVVGDS
ncbi:hypothetical protein HLB15_19390, partial [Promicromonospora citrea]